MTWVPVDACFLPTVKQPLRAAVFDDLFRDALEAVDLPGPTTAVLPARDPGPPPAPETSPPARPRAARSLPLTSASTPTAPSS